MSSEIHEEVGKVRRNERDLDYAYVRDLKVGGLRTIFIRLARRGEIAMVDDIVSFSPWDTDVTIDEVDGKVVGVNISWSEPQLKED